MGLKVRRIERYHVLMIVDLMAAIILFVSGPTCYLSRGAAKETDTPAKEFLEEKALPKPVIKIYRIDYSHSYIQFPQNFDQYQQRISIKQVDEGWIISSRIFSGKSGIEGEYVKNPYVRLIDSEAREIAKLTIYRGRMGEEKNTAILKESSLLLTQLPASYGIYIGYECSYGSGQAERSYFKEFDLDLGIGLDYQREDYTVEFIYKKVPPVHFAEYGQMVALFNSEKKSVLWSRIFGGELTSGDDYVVDPYVRIVDSEGKEITKLLIYRGKVGSLRGSVRGPQENTVSLATLPLTCELYVGYQLYYDNSYRDKAGGPLEIEIGQFPKGIDNT